MKRRIVILALVLVIPTFAVVQAGEKEDLATLVSRLEDPVTREAAARDLVEKGEAALPILGKALRAGDSSDLLRREIVALLPRFGAAGIPPLKGALSDRRIELEAVRQLATIDALDKVLPVMTLALESTNPKVREAAILWIKSTGSTAPKLSTLLFSLLTDPSEEVRNTAGELIARELGKDALPTLMELYRKETTRPSRSNLLLRQVLIRTLGIVGATTPMASDRVIPTLIQALYRKDQQKVSAAALVGLGERAVPSLLMVLKQGDVKRAPAAMEAIMRIGPEAAPEVVSLLTARHSKMRELAIQFLSFYKDPAILPILLRTFKKGDPLVRSSVIRIAGLYRDEGAIQLMELGLKDKDANVRLKAMEMIAKSGLPMTVPLLLARAEEDPELNIRIAALRALFYLGETSAVPSMVRMLQYEKWPLRMEILEALLWMGRAGHVEAVADQLAHRKPEIANLAERVLANLSYLEGERSIEDWGRDVKALQRERLGKYDTTVSLNRKEIRAGDISIDVQVAGTPDRGTILLMRSGDGVDDPWFLESLRPLVDDYRIVLMDFPGCDMVAGDSRPDLDQCMAWHGERIELVRSAFTSGKVILISHSVAAYAAAWYAAKHPDAVSKLILVSPIYPSLPLLRETVRRIEDGIPTRWRKELEQLEGLRGRMNPRAYHRYRHRAELAALVSGQGVASLVGSYYGLSWFLSEVYISEGDTGLEAAFAQIRAPVLLVLGENDPVPPGSLSSFRRIGRIRGNYMVTTIPAAMHFPQISRPKIFESAVEKFLWDVKVAEVGPSVGLAPTAVVSVGERGLVGVTTASSQPVSLQSVGPDPVGLAQMLSVEPVDTGTVEEGPTTSPTDPVVVATTNPVEDPDTPKDPAGFAAIEPVGQGGDPNVSKSLKRRPAPFWPWFTVAMGGAVAVAGGVVNHLAMEDGRRANRLDPFMNDYENRFDQTVRDAQTKMIIAYSGYGLGAVGIGVGLWLALTSPPRSVAEERRSWKVAPLIGACGPMGLAGTLRF